MKVAYLLGPTLLSTVVAASSIAACSSDGDQGLSFAMSMGPL
ncbi:hypothetical protein [Mycobacterium antarcticum]|nr:hypothetical protein [Mycolicibacterium sp. TUM20985]